MRHFLEIDDLSAAELDEVLDRAQRDDLPKVLAGRTVALYFEKPSLRTRHSCETAVVQLGGHPVTFRADEVGPGSREPLGDIARVLAGYHAALGARVYDHGDVVALAGAAALPIVNLLSNDSQPCQALADLLTLKQEWGTLDGHTVAWVGDFSNVARSLCLGAALAGMSIRVGSPPGYGPSETDLDRLAAAGAAAVFVTSRPDEAAKDADAVSTDVFTSMGFEAEADARSRAFEGWTVDGEVMAMAASRAVFLHCLPAHRGEEVAAAVIDGPQSRVFPQAHNRMHAFRGLLSWILDQ